MIALVQAARLGLEALAGRLTQIFWGDASGYKHLSPEGRRLEASSEIGAASAALLGPLEDARREDLPSGKKRVQEKIEELTGFADEVIASRAVVFGPILTGVLDNREVLLNLYARRFDNLLDRRVLEEIAEGVLDGLAGSAVGAEFHQRWEALKQELDARRPSEERQAGADLATLEELEGFLEQATGLIRDHLAALERGGGPTPEEQVGLERRRADVDTFISRHHTRSGATGELHQGAVDMWGRLVNPGG